MPSMHAIEFDAWMEEAVREVLESMCFLSTIGPTSAQAVDEDWIACRLHFTGYPNGNFGVLAPKAIARIIAANFLGEDEQDLTVEQVVEVMCEVANMICGAILGQLNPKRTYSLSSPLRDLQLFMPTSEAAASADQIWRTYALDEGTINTWFEVEADS